MCSDYGVSLQELDLPHQVTDNTSVLGTPFTVTVDKLEGCTTGVSAADRAATIQALADPLSTPATFGRPGHINPLYAQEKGVLRRAGHTEATIDMCRLSGFYPAGALMEIMNEDGTMARLPELRKMADEFNTLVATSFEIEREYRLKKIENVTIGVAIKKRPFIVVNVGNIYSNMVGIDTFLYEEDLTLIESSQLGKYNLDSLMIANHAVLDHREEIEWALENIKERYLEELERGEK